MGELILHKTKDRVGVSYGRTINVGNFESVKLDVSYSSDVKKEESLDEAFTRVEAAASSKLEELCRPIEEATNKGGNKNVKRR